MCTEEKFHALERRVAAIETDMSEVKVSLEKGFSEMKSMLAQYADERKLWSEWLRHALSKALKIVGFIILAACGINQIGKVAALFAPHVQTAVAQ